MSRKVGAEQLALEPINLQIIGTPLCHHMQGQWTLFVLALKIDLCANCWLCQAAANSCPGADLVLGMRLIQALTEELCDSWMSGLHERQARQKVEGKALQRDSKIQLSRLQETTNVLGTLVINQQIQILQLHQSEILRHFEPRGNAKRVAEIGLERAGIQAELEWLTGLPLQLAREASRRCSRGFETPNAQMLHCNILQCHGHG